MRKIGSALVGALALATAARATAAVTTSSPHGFEVRHSVPLVVPPEAAWASFLDIAKWWSPEHSWSGDAWRLRLEPRAGGCFCETLPSGGWAEHLRVVYADPAKHKLVLSGALGPLNEMAASGSMIVRIERVAGGSRLDLVYRVAGLYAGNGAVMAGPVDRVLGEQVRSFRAFAASAKAPDPLADR